MLTHFWNSLFQKRRSTRQEPEIKSSVNVIGNRVSIEAGKQYCYLKDNQPHGDGLIISPVNIVTQLHWNEGVINGEIIVANCLKKSLLFVGQVKEECIVSSVDLLQLGTEVIDLDAEGSRWEGQTLHGVPFGWGCLYDATNCLRYQGFRIKSYNVCFGTYFYDGSGNDNQVFYKGTLCNSLRWGWGSLYDRLQNQIYEGIFINDSNQIAELCLPDSSPTVEHFHVYVEELILGDYACVNVNVFDIANHHHIRRIVIGTYCFSNQMEDTRFVLVNLPLLEEVIIDVHSFEYFTYFSVRSIVR